MLANGPELSLDNLLARGFTDLDHALVVFFAGLRNSKNMLPRGNVSQHDASGTSDASLTFVVYINFRSDRCEYHQSRGSASFTVIDIFGSFLELLDPGRNIIGSSGRIDLQRLHDQLVDFRRNIRAESRQRGRLVHDLLHDKLHHVADERRLAAEH